MAQKRREKERSFHIIAHRKQYDSPFKAQVAIEAIKNQQTAKSCHETCTGSLMKPENLSRCNRIPGTRPIPLPVCTPTSPLFSSIYRQLGERFLGQAPLPNRCIGGQWDIRFGCQ